MTVIYTARNGEMIRNIIDACITQIESSMTKFNRNCRDHMKYTKHPLLKDQV